MIDSMNTLIVWLLPPILTQSPVTDQAPSLESSEDAVFDDSGVLDVTSSSNNSGPNLPNTTSRDSASSGVASVGGISTSEKWAQVCQARVCLNTVRLGSSPLKQ